MQCHIALQSQIVSMGWVLRSFCNWWRSFFIILVRLCGWKCLFWCSGAVREVSDLSRGARYFLLLLESRFLFDVCKKPLTFWCQISFLVFLGWSLAATYFRNHVIRPIRLLADHKFLQLVLVEYSKKAGCSGVWAHSSWPAANANQGFLERVEAVIACCKAKWKHAAAVVLDFTTRGWW